MDLNSRDIINNAMEQGIKDSKKRETAIDILVVLSSHKATVSEAISALDEAKDLILQSRINLQLNSLKRLFVQDLHKSVNNALAEISKTPRRIKYDN